MLEGQPVLLDVCSCVEVPTRVRRELRWAAKSFRRQVGCSCVEVPKGMQRELRRTAGLLDVGWFV